MLKEGNSSKTHDYKNEWLDKGGITPFYLGCSFLVLCSNLLNLGNLQYYRVFWLGTRGRGMAGMKITMATTCL